MNASESPPTSSGLLHLLAGEGNDAAWVRFLERYVPMIEEWSRGYGLQEADRDEVRSRVIQGLLSALRSLKYDPAKSFRGYLHRTVTNAVYKVLIERKQKPGNFGIGGESQFPLEQLAEQESLRELAEQLDESLNDDLRAVQRLMARVKAIVSKVHWRAYELTALEGKSAAEAAHELSMSIAAIYMAKSRVGKLLRQESQTLGEG
jgi:RNA polymerase sigma-70 factor, ECF subfamily